MSNLLDDKDLENQLKIHASMLESPKFAIDMLEKEKGIVNSEINMVSANPESIALNNTLKLLFNIKTTSKDIVAGTTDNITNLTRDDVVNYYNNNYHPANMVTVISGEVNPDDTMKLISKYFQSKKLPPKSRHYEELKPIEKTVRQDIISDKTKSPCIIMGFKGPENDNLKDIIHTNALNKLLFRSSDAQKVYNKLNADVYGFQEKILAKTDAPKALLIAGEVSEENSEALLRKIYGQIHKQQTQLINDDDLNILKRDMKKSFVNMFESSIYINNLIGTSMLDNRVDAINEYEKIIDEMTPQDIQNAAKKYYDLNKAAITVLHPASAEESSLNENYNNSQNISFTGANHKKAYNIEDVEQYKLPNNYNVVMYNSKLIPNVNAKYLIKTKTPVVPKNPATFVVLNEILSKGTLFKSEDEFNKLKEKNGVGIFLFACQYGLVGDYDCDVKDFEKGDKLFNELLKNPRLNKETFEKAVKDVQDRLSRREKSPLNKLIPELDNSRHTNEEILEGLKTITLYDVIKTYQDLMVDNTGITSFAAPYDSNPELKNKIFATVNTLKPVSPYSPQLIDMYEPINESKVLTETDNKNQANIVMAYKFKVNDNIKDTVAMNLMNIILGGAPTSRLFNDLREKQKLAYHVKSKIDKEQTTGTMLLNIETTTDNKSTGEQSFDNLQKSINGFKDNIEKIKNEKVTEEELEKAKLTFKNIILSDNESVVDKGSSALNSAGGFYGIDYENQLLEVIDTITVDDIYNAANYIFAGKPIYSIVATQDTLDFNKDYLNNLVK